MYAMRLLALQANHWIACVAYAPDLIAPFHFLLNPVPLLRLQSERSLFGFCCHLH